MIDIVGNFQQGLQFGQEQRKRKIEEQEKQQLRDLAPKIMRGDPSAYTQAATINPETANSYQDAGDRNYRRVTNVAKLMRGAINSKNEQVKQQAFSQIRPFLSELSGGRPVPETWDDSMLPGFEQFEARIQQAQAVPKDIPSGFQQFKLTAEAAGLTPGSPEYQQAAKIALGQEGRAASGGYSFEMIKGADGRERPARRNPRNGIVEVFTGDTWVPLGGPAAMGGPAQPEMGPGTYSTPAGIVKVGDLTADEQQAMLADIQAGGTANSVQLPERVVSPRQFGQSSAGLAVGRSPEEQAALTSLAQEQAKVQTDLQYADQVAQADANKARLKAEAEAAAKAQAERDAVAATKTVDANRTLGLLDEAEKLLSGATGSRAGSVIDSIAAAGGYSTAGAQATAALQTIAGQLTSSMPRMQGPQSDRDVQLYQQMAGDLANSNLPVQTRLAALKTIRALNQKYIDQQSAKPTQPNVRRYNPATGRLE